MTAGRDDPAKATAAADVGATAALAAFAATSTAEAIPDDARQAAARLLLDTLGCMLAGAGSEAARLSRAWLVASGLGRGPSTGAEATVVGAEHGAPPIVAAYANGRAAAALDADETYPSDRQTSHLAAATVASALALTESSGGTKDDLLTAIVAGYEVGTRICDGLVPAEGQGGTGLRAGWGPGSVLGATAAAGRASRLDTPRLAHALGIAGTHIDPPPLQWTETVPAPMTKSADAGWHALSAVAAVGMAAQGLTGYDRILDGERGLWRALGYAGWDAKAATHGLGERWVVTEAAFKRWPAQYWMQPALTAFWRILDEHGLTAGDLEHVELAVNDKCLAPRFQDPEPPGEVDRAFSIPHAVAMLALRVPAGPGWSADEVADRPAVRSLRPRVTVVRHPDAGRISEWVVDHQIRDLPARATVRARDVTYTAETRFGLGTPWSPDSRLTDAALVAKFQEMTEGLGRGVEGDGADAIARWAFDAPPEAPVRDLFRHICSVTHDPSHATRPRR